MNRKEHWENIYITKKAEDLSWYQPVPETGLSWILKNARDKDAAIIDIGAGDSFLVDHLLDEGYTDITILDISDHAISRTKKRLGNKAERVKWVISDVIHFKPTRKYDFWYDRAAFHFLTDASEIVRYKHLLLSSIQPGGKALIGAFSENGPVKCSGINVLQYSKADFNELFKEEMELSDFLNVDHQTPSNAIQNFNFVELKLKG